MLLKTKVTGLYSVIHYKIMCNNNINNNNPNTKVKIIIMYLESNLFQSSTLSLFERFLFRLEHVVFWNTKSKILSRYLDPIISKWFCLKQQRQEQRPHIII